MPRPTKRFVSHPPDLRRNGDDPLIPGSFVAGDPRYARRQCAGREIVEVPAEFGTPLFDVFVGPEQFGDTRTFQRPRDGRSGVPIIRALYLALENGCSCRSR